MKYLIINADDFGMSKVFNKVIIELIERGQVLSTSVMVNRGNLDYSERLKTSKASIGLHFEFETDYQKESEEQYEKFILIFGFKPSHVDVHRSRDAIASLPFIKRFCEKYKVPCRNTKTEIKEKFSGTFVDMNSIIGYIKTFEDDDIYEIHFHPGKYDPNCKSSLNADREKDIEKIRKLNELLPEYDIRSVNYLDIIKS